MSLNVVLGLGAVLVVGIVSIISAVLKEDCTGCAKERDSGCSCLMCRLCCLRQYPALPRQWSKADHKNFPKTFRDSALFVLMCVRRKYPSLKHVATLKILPYMAWNSTHCPAHQRFCHSVTKPELPRYGLSRPVQEPCNLINGKRCIVRQCVRHCSIKWCDEHGDARLCQSCGARQKRDGCAQHFCDACCKRTLDRGEHGYDFRARFRPAVAPPKCLRHTDRCRRLDCDEVMSSNCEERRCEQCCTVAWCNAHGNPNVCRKCLHTDSELGCCFLQCRGCCKATSRYTQCDVHCGLCSFGQCVQDAGVECISAGCVGCCNVPWCGLHGNPLACRGCAATTYAGGCRDLLCDKCCKRRGGKCDGCGIHGHQCQLCHNQRSKSCCSRRCNRCCDTKWCGAHGNPQLCHACGNVKKTPHCVGSKCSSCCSAKGKCRVHFGCLARACPQWREADCTQSACRSCCTDRVNCWHSLCVSGSCRQQSSSKCDGNKCGGCCRNRYCAAHGNPNLCRRCLRQNGSLGCIQKFCNRCCQSNRSQCKVHHRVCFDCGDNMASFALGCRFSCCAACCKKHIQDPEDCNEHGTRWFGSFKCPCGSKWSSAFAYKGWSQRCRRCRRDCYGVQFVAHTGGNTEGDVNKPHDEAGCERCRTGLKCRQNRSNSYQQRNRGSRQHYPSSEDNEDYYGDYYDYDYD